MFGKSFSVFRFPFIVKPLGSGAFGQVTLAQATGIIAFDPRGSTKRKLTRRRSRFGSTSRPYYNDKRVTAVAVKSLKGESFVLTLFIQLSLSATATLLSLSSSSSNFGRFVYELFRCRAVRY